MALQPVVLVDRRRQTPYPADDPWAPASSAKEGKEPVWLETVPAGHDRPARERAGDATSSALNVATCEVQDW